MDAVKVVTPTPESAAPAAPERNWRAPILADFSLRLISGQNPDREALPALFQALAAREVIDGLIAFVVDEREAGMRLGAIEGFDPATVRQCLRLDFGQAICGTVAARRRAMHVTDIQRSLDPLADLIRSAGVSAYASQPVMVGDRLLGTLSFASRARRAFETEHLHLLRDVSALLAVARERLRSAKG